FVSVLEHGFFSRRRRTVGNELPVLKEIGVVLRNIHRDHNPLPRRFGRKPLDRGLITFSKLPPMTIRLQLRYGGQHQARREDSSSERRNVRFQGPPSHSDLLRI